MLDECLQERYGVRFRHNHHSLRMVERVERDGEGLNLTEQVRDGILNHTGDGTPATLEGKIVRVVDRIAYINHDIDDAIRAGRDPVRGPARATRSPRWATRARRGSRRWCATCSSARRPPGTSCRARTWAGRC